LPGQKATGTARVTNNTFQPQDIAVEAINYPGFPNPNNVPTGDLSRALSIIIREKGGSDLYGGTTGEKTLFDFYKKVGFNSIYEHVLTYNLPGYGGTTTYEFVINFPSEKENKWQAATTTFDILIGFQGKEDGPPPLPPPAGPGLPPGLTISEESVRATTTETSVTITWITNYFSTSQVIYATSSGKFNLAEGPPRYGYSFYKEGDDSGQKKVKDHSVTLTGLTPDTKYYYRTVSHASLAVSREHRFTTLGEKTEEEIPLKEIGVSEIIRKIPERITKEVKRIIERITPPPAEAEKPEEFVPEGAAPVEEGIVTVPLEERAPPKERAPEERLGSLLLASLGKIGETAWMAIIVVFCIIGLVVIGIRERELAQKKKKKLS